VVRSFAKINVYLAVRARREDGYHEIESLLCPVSIHDTITLAPEKAGIIRVTCPAPGVPEDETNLAHKAARLFSQSLGQNPGVHIHIEKAIPAGAGLGGGSSNAATVLGSLNQMSGFPFSAPELARMAASLGADVPFFLLGKPAWATGIGDVLEPFTGLEPQSVVIVYPGFEVSTVWAYKNLNLTLTMKQKNHTVRWAKTGHLNAVDILFNDLESVTIPGYPEIGRVKEALVCAGAGGALMSGSGSSVFGLFSDARQAQAARAFLASGHGQWSVFCARMLV